MSPWTLWARAVPTKVWQALGAFALVVAIFFSGYLMAVHHISRDARPSQEAIQHEKAADAHAEAAKTADLRVAQQEKVIIRTRSTVKKAREAAVQAKSFLPPPQIMPSEKDEAILKLQDLVEAQDQHIAALESQNATLKISSDQWQQAFHEERARSLALEAQMKVIAAQHQKDLFHAKFKSFTIGFGIGGVGGFILGRHR